jgi:metal-responsive CopG/Arc/MetJ family transcriptional regulator
MTIRDEAQSKDKTVRQVSIYLEKNVLLALDELALKRRRESDQVVKRSHLIRKAIEQYLKRELPGFKASE